MKKNSLIRLLARRLHAIFVIVVFFYNLSCYGADGEATKAIAAGPYSTVALRNDGTAWAWGTNAFGESGPGPLATVITNASLLSPALSNIVAVSSGGWESNYVAHTLALRNDGVAWACGNGAFGQLGNGSLTSQTNFVPITGVSNFISVAAGGFHSLGLRSDGTVWTWGANNFGQIGNGTTGSPQPTPAQVANLTNIVAVAAGINHSLALRSDGTVWAWGENDSGQIGDATRTSRSTATIVTNVAGAIAISAGGSNSMALTSSGFVLAWGDDQFGQIGIGATGAAQTNPIAVAGLTNAIAIASGGFHSVAIKADGTIWSWGRNNLGQLGDGTTVQRTSPVLVTNLTGAVAVAAGAYHSVAALSDGTVAEWGFNRYGQLGNGRAGVSTNASPILVKGFGGVGLAVENHSLAVKLDGTVWAFGYNAFGELGDNTTVNRLKPTAVRGQFETIAASAGGGHSLGLKLDGSVWSWGCNGYGQLGNGSTANSVQTTSVTNIGGCLAISSGGLHSLALTTNGFVWAWGCNGQGQLGDGSQTNHTAPFQLQNLSNVSAIAAGGHHSLALSNNGTVWAWGCNASGQLGDATTTNRINPVLTFGLSGVSAIAAGGQHSLAVSNGFVWAWGNNLCGQLGINGTNNSSAPVQVSGLSGIAAVTAGSRFSAALSSNGVVWTWGYNAFGQLGDGTRINRLVPVKATNVNGAVTIAAGDNHLMVTLTNGAVLMIGDNENGQIGDDTTANQSLAEQVPHGFSLVQPNYSSFVPNTNASGAAVTVVSQVNADLFYAATVSPLSGQQGIPLDFTEGDNTNLFGGREPWFSLVNRDVRYIYDSITFNINGLSIVPGPFINPLMAFGSLEGATPLYVGQSYHFGIYAGERVESANNPEFATPIRILVYSRASFLPGLTNVAPIATNDIYVPRKTIKNDSTNWTQFAANGYVTSSNAYGLLTTIKLLEPYTTNHTTTNIFGRGGLDQYILTHTASDAATNYFYRVEAIGACLTSTSWSYMVTNSSGSYSRAILYTLDFAEHPWWRSPFVDEPQYEGVPQPSFYTDADRQSLTNPSPTISFSTNLNDACTNIDSSPELLRHPILDQFVSSMNNNPIALARYVFNEISLSDYMAYGASTNTPYNSINLGGVNRSALDTFLEKSGSPAEQCALLVYLLRQAGYKAAYMYPTNNNLMMLDKHLDALLRMRVSGAQVDGYPYTGQQYIVVNYPWVLLNIGTNTVHLFPWLKDTQITEGLDLYDYLPTNCNSGFKWVKNYVYGNTNVIQSIYSSNDPAELFPAYIQNSLLANYPGISLDDIGARIVNRRHEYASWSDFPIPDVVSNLNTAVVVQDFATITNNIRWMTNYFDTVRVDLLSADGSTTLLTTLNMRMSDIFNRRFLAYTNGGKVVLWMASFRTNITGVGSFGSSLTNAYLAVQSNSVSIGANTAFQVRFVYKRHQFSHTNNADPVLGPYLGLGEEFNVTNTRPLLKKDIAGLCMNIGRVTKDMLQVHAQEYWQQELKKDQNTNYVPSIADNQGAAAYLMGMTYFERYAQWADEDRQLHKITSDAISQFQAGLAKISTATAGNVQPGLDMPIELITSAANETLRTDANVDAALATENYYWTLIAGGSAEEHQTIDEFFQSTNAISTVMLLQLAQSRSASGAAGIVELHKYDYGTLGGLASAGYGATVLSNYDGSIWRSVNNVFTNTYGEFAYAFVTPAPITNADFSYKGMGALIFSYGLWSGLISTNMNGAYGLLTPDFLATSGSSLMTYSLFADASGNYVFNLNSSLSIPGVSETIATFNLADNISIDYDNSFQNYDAGLINVSLQLGGATTPQALTTSVDRGWLGIPSFFSTLWNWVADPVSPVTGEFYVDSLDLRLPGPMPLDIRRNYSSQNTANNQFGHGWKMSYMPYLVLATNSTSLLKILYAAEMDGSVIGYRQTAANSALYVPIPADNPQLNNNGQRGIGSTANPFNGSITNYVQGATQCYDLKGADGSLRHFTVQSFPISNATNTITRQRPYLAKWQDAHGNFYTFSFGTDSTQPDYGQVNRIQGSGGNFLQFGYDVYQHITTAYTGDGRVFNYDYDNHGDLVTVTRPDATQINYSYQHIVTPTNTFSTHLITEEIKPDGRVLENIYDASNRVTAQLATVGPDLNLYTNAQFSYSNNYSANPTNPISGSTFITDVNGNTTRYYYTNSLITTIVDPLGYSIQQSWYLTNDAAGGYQQSLHTTTDKRGLTTTYSYDTFGNLATNVISGSDLTGDGLTSVTNVYFYSTNTLMLLSSVDPMGNQVQMTYGDTNYPYLPTSIQRLSSNGVSITVNQLSYTNCFQLVTNGNLLLTNQSYGLLTRTIAAAGTPDASTNDVLYDGRGFAYETIKYTGTADPNVTNFMLVDARGELVQSSDGAGRRTVYAYDGMGRVIGKQVFESGATIPLSAEFSYYNDNGELLWADGPRSNPEDYVWSDYDGAGRKTQEIHWRSRASANGSGVEAETGDNLYATVFFEYDGFNNLVKESDQLGNYTRMSYDALGRLVDKRSYTMNNPAPLTVERYSYEGGGLVAAVTNALGGVTYKSYTTTGKLKQQVNADGTTQSFTYYADGRPRREYLPNGNYYETTYDDANRTSARTFSGDSGYREAQSFDHRGNLVETTNAAGAVFATVYDGLDRPKQSIGPASQPGSQQQITTYAYDAVGRQLITTNALGQYSITYFDALGRACSNAVYDANYSRVSISSSIYSADFNSVTTISGSGINTISNTVFTDTYGKPVLTKRYPSAGAAAISVNVYDVTEHLVSSIDELGRTTQFSYDPLYRLSKEAYPDGSSVTFAYNPAGSLTNRSMPGGLTWSSSYDAANRILSEQLSGGSAVSRQFNYQYYNSGPSIGLLQTKTETGRGVTVTASYDAFSRIATNLTAGPLPQQNMQCSYQYDRRGLTTNLTEVDATGSSTVQRAYDNYGQMTEEKVWLNANLQSDYTQSWDGAGRRVQLSQAGSSLLGSATYGYRADGSMTNILQAGNNFGFSYADNGFISARANPWRSWSATQRDGEGRLLGATATVGSSNALVETLSWSTNSEINTYAASRVGDGAWNDSRAYSYDLRNRLVAEPVGITNGVMATNFITLDSAKLGIVVGTQWRGGVSNSWSAGAMSSLAQVTAENLSESNVTLRAHGAAINASSVSTKLDGVPVVNTFAGGGWHSDLKLVPGNHALAATAAYATGSFSATATSAFSVAGTNGVLDYYDSSGNVTNRVFADGRNQTLNWDALGRLVSLTEQINSTNGFYWLAVYDCLGRRIRTVQMNLTNGVPDASNPLTIDSFYDPLVEFEELGVAVNGSRTWKIMGPDMNSQYGSLQGVGGLEATAAESDGTITPVLNDYWGNVLATVSGPSIFWNPVRVSGYGPVLGYRASTLNPSTPLAETLLWRSHRIDPSGFYYLGARYYDPQSARFISADPMGHAASMDLYSSFNSDPLNYFDSNGRIGKDTLRFGEAAFITVDNLAMSIAMQPFLALERTFFTLKWPELKPFYFQYMTTPFVRSAESGYNFWQLSENADPIATLLAFLHQTPIIGNFLPTISGNFDGPMDTVWQIPGINGEEGRADSRDALSRQSMIDNGLIADVKSATWVDGTAVSVFFASLLGYSADALNIAGIINEGQAPDTTIGIDAHSGGVETGSIASGYLALQGIGVKAYFAEQGPGLGYFGNIENLSANYSVGVDPISLIGTWVDWAYFGNSTTINASYWPGPGDAPRSWEHAQAGNNNGFGNLYNGQREGFFNNYSNP